MRKWFLNRKTNMNGILLCLALLGAPNQKDLDELVTVRQNLEMIFELQSRGCDVDKDGKATSKLVDKAGEILGVKDPSMVQIVEATGGSSAKTPSTWEKAKGFVTFANIVLVIAVILVVGAAIALFGHYFLALILLVPSHAWNVITWAGCGAMVILADRLGDLYLGLALPGCLGMVGCSLLTYNLYFRSNVYDNYSYQRTNEFCRMFGLILAVLWGAAAIHLNDHLLGFMAVGSLMVGVGFVAGVIPGVAYVGFESEKVIPRATMSAALILSLHVILVLSGNTMDKAEVFREGMVSLGSFVTYLGLLVMASKAYHYTSWWRSGEKFLVDSYMRMQAITIAAGVAALLIGSVYGMPVFLGVGGTFFCLYLIEKYYEIPWQGVGWLWSVAGLGVILYAFAMFAKQHPEFFFMG